MSQQLGFKRSYDDKSCRVIVLTDGQEVADSDPARLQRLTNRIISGQFKPFQVRTLARNK